MNFLQLCQATALDSGTVAGVPSLNTLVAASGRVAQLASWVRDAYIDIQNERSDWLFMRKRFLATLTIGQNTFSAAGLGIEDLGDWLPDIPSEGWRNITIYEDGNKAQEGSIEQIPYHLWIERYARGSHDSQQPVAWAISPQNELLVGPTPDKAYIIAGEYRIEPQELRIDNDVPLMPSKFHRVIVGEALRLMARSDEAFQVLAEKSQQYERLRAPLTNSQTPDISFGGSSFA